MVDESEFITIDEARQLAADLVNAANDLISNPTADLVLPAAGRKGGG